MRNPHASGFNRPKIFYIRTLPETRSNRWYIKNTPDGFMQFIEPVALRCLNLGYVDYMVKSLMPSSCCQRHPTLVRTRLCQMGAKKQCMLNDGLLRIKLTIYKRKLSFLIRVPTLQTIILECNTSFLAILYFLNSVEGLKM